MDLATRLRIEELKDLLVEVYAAIDGDSNDLEHEALWACMEFLESEVQNMGGELPPRADEEDD